jgi:hypothetical protein
LAGLLKGGLSRYWLRLAVVELTLRVDVQPASRVGKRSSHSSLDGLT